MALFSLPIYQLQALCFIFLRMTSILFWMPIFDSKNIPLLYKLGLSFALSLMLLPMLGHQTNIAPDNTVMLVIGIMTEVAMGFCIGLSVKLIFTAIQFGGEIVGYQMGLAIANVFDPNTGGQVSIISHFKYMVAVLVFLSIDAHYVFFKAIVECFMVIPPYGFHMSNSLAAYMIKLGGNMFIIALKLSSPLLVTLLFTSIALGLVARTVPQMNVFFVAMPLKLIIGFGCMGLVLPILISFFCYLFNDMADILTLLIKVIGTSWCRTGSRIPDIG